MLNYEFKPGYLHKIGIKRLNLGIGVADITRFSSVKQNEVRNILFNGVSISRLDRHFDND